MIFFRLRPVKFSLAALLLTAAMMASYMAAAQQRPAAGLKKSQKETLPHLGAIKDGKMATAAIYGGCNHHFLRLAVKPEADENIFISNAEGWSAWMNLDGRDVLLEIVKTTLWYERFTGNAYAHHEYRAGKLRIKVSFWQYSDYTTEYPARIELRKGRARRMIRAIGQPQCDAL